MTALSRGIAQRYASSDSLYYGSRNALAQYAVFTCASRKTSRLIETDKHRQAFEDLSFLQVLVLAVLAGLACRENRETAGDFHPVFFSFFLLSWRTQSHLPLFRSEV